MKSLRKFPSRHMMFRIFLTCGVGGFVFLAIEGSSGLAGKLYAREFWAPLGAKASWQGSMCELREGKRTHAIIDVVRCDAAMSRIKEIKKSTATTRQRIGIQETNYVNITYTYNDQTFFHTEKFPIYKDKTKKNILVYVNPNDPFKYKNEITDEDKLLVLTNIFVGALIMIFMAIMGLGVDMLLLWRESHHHS